MKSPLKARPLRTPGESLVREINDILFDKVVLYLAITCMLTFVALSEWFRWYFAAPPQPVLWSVIAAAAIAAFLWYVRVARRDLGRLRLGLDGERAVGEFLERLRASGAKVFHDIPGEGFNLDHVVIHETGVYVIETKTRSKPDRGETRLIFDGEAVRKSGWRPDPSPIVQVRAGSRWLAELLKESTGRSFAVRPVVVYPGWYIEPTAEAKSSDVWVLNPKALPSFIAHSKAQLQPEDVSLCAFHLGRYVRTTA